VKGSPVAPLGRTLGAFVLLVLPAAVEAQERPVFAVLPFENSGSYGQDKEIFEALELGLPAVLARTLGAIAGARVADQGRVNQALTAAGLGPGERIDAGSAAEIAKAAGARYTVTGSFSDFYGKFRVNARVVNAQSGEILKVVSNDDPKLQDRAQLSAILQVVSEKIAEAAGLAAGLAAGTGAGALPTEAITDFSRGLLHESRGDRAGAREFYQRAVRAAPGFEEAQAGLQRVRGG
jgi:TolB-like protein